MVARLTDHARGVQIPRSAIILESLVGQCQSRNANTICFAVLLNSSVAVMSEQCSAARQDADLEERAYPGGRFLQHRFMHASCEIFSLGTFSVRDELKE